MCSQYMKVQAKQCYQQIHETLDVNLLQYIYRLIPNEFYQAIFWESGILTSNLAFWFRKK